VNQFFMLGGETYLIRNNNRLDIVVYAPEGVEVRYHVYGPLGRRTKVVEKG
jgi:serine protease inhibitor ecotin